MADKQIGNLPQAGAVSRDSMIPVEQGGSAQHITGAQIEDFAKSAAEKSAKDAAADSLMETKYVANIALNGQGPGSSFTATAYANQTTMVSFANPLEAGRRYILSAKDMTTDEYDEDEIVYTLRGFEAGFGLYVEPVSSTQVRIESKHTNDIQVVFRPTEQSVYAAPTAEYWTFTLEDGSTVTKAVYVG